MSTTENQAATISGKHVLRWIVMPFAASLAQLLAFIPLVIISFISLIAGKVFSTSVLVLGLPVALFFSGYLYTATVILISPAHKKMAALVMLGISAVLSILNLLMSIISHASGNMDEMADFSASKVAAIYLIVVFCLLVNLSGSYYKYRKAYSIKGFL